MDKEVINEEIRTIEVSNNVSNVAKIKEVRQLMVEVQRKIGMKSSVILDGRDIGSYVFPMQITNSFSSYSRRKRK